MNAANFINTPLQRGAGTTERCKNRFNGVPRTVETVKTVSIRSWMLNTALKRGVNENSGLPPLLAL
jgi:hypothetical protein